MCERERDRETGVSLDMMQLPCNVYRGMETGLIL